MARIKVQIGDVVVEVESKGVGTVSELLDKCMKYATDEARRGGRWVPRSATETAYAMGMNPGDKVELEPGETVGEAIKRIEADTLGEDGYTTGEGT